MDGTLTIEEGTLYDFLVLIAQNFNNARSHPMLRALATVESMLHRSNPISTAQRNVRHHYDLSKRLYELFLDDDQQYSCAYFDTGNETLEEAQARKKAHILAKLWINRSGLRVLDIGCGWGGLAFEIARRTGSQVVGITLSPEQHAIATARAHNERLAHLVRIELQDYRETNGQFDRIVSVGMFEHVGKRHYDLFFRRVRELLADGGVAMIHSIGWSDEPAAINPVIRKYIFPGADIPSLSEVLIAVERCGLFVTDVEILRQHYALTLAHWRSRFERNRDEIRSLYDERFCRMWEFYLTACEVFFRYRTMMVFQMQLSKQLNTLPITRDYIYRALSSEAPPIDYQKTTRSRAS